MNPLLWALVLWAVVLDIAEPTTYNIVRKVLLKKLNFINNIIKPLLFQEANQLMEVSSMKIKTVAIIGLGALGITFGNHLAKRMPFEDLRIIADKDRIERYKRDKVYCNDKICNFNYMEPDEKCIPADLIIFCTKYNTLEDAIKAVKNQVGERTIMLSALNGIISEEIIGKEYGMDKVLYCVAQGMDSVKVGNRVTYTNMGILCFGEGEPGIISPKVKAVSEFFDSKEFPYEVETNMYRRLWSKFMLNVGINQTAAVYLCNYGGAQKEGDVRSTMIAAMREVVAISEAVGIRLTEKDIDYWLDVLSKLSPDGKPSMQQDVEAGRCTEVELFAGTVLKYGAQYGIPTPVNRMLYDKIKSYENSLLYDN